VTYINRLNSNNNTGSRSHVYIVE